MTDTRFYLAIGVPILFNGLMFLLTNQRISDLRDSLDRRINDMGQRISSLESRFEMLIGKVAELCDRMARVEERLEHMEHR